MTRKSSRIRLAIVGLTAFAFSASCHDSPLRPKNDSSILVTAGITAERLVILEVTLSLDGEVVARESGPTRVAQVFLETVDDVEDGPHELTIQLVDLTSTPPTPWTTFGTITFFDSSRVIDLPERSFDILEEGDTVTYSFTR